MNEGKAVIIFIMLSGILLVGIGLLPRSPVTASVTAPVTAPVSAIVSVTTEQ